MFFVQYAQKKQVIKQLDIFFSLFWKKTEAKNQPRIGHFAMISYNVIYGLEILT